MRPTSCSPRSTPRRARSTSTAAEQSVSLSDTVGFIRDLPHKLVEAFRATLQEATDADLLLHVVDASSPQLDEQRDEVERVLAEIGAARRAADRWSTTSSTRSQAAAARADATGSTRDDGTRVPRVFVSATQGSGLDVLRAWIGRAAAGEALSPPPTPPHEARALSPRLPDNPTHRPKPQAPHDPAPLHGFDRPPSALCARLALAWRAGLAWLAAAAAAAAGLGMAMAGRNDGPPDLDELWRDFNRKLGGLFGGKGGGRARRSPSGGGRRSSPT